ncbi:MAG: multidrug effflux MFS transporter [Rhizobiaceae bacterium]|nr:multidrug effflux MFS transporter [Rhizobiaceae bacterium]MCC0043694.1 multidrug effflux MFS transporter [Brucellaceae bacterium]
MPPRWLDRTTPPHIFTLVIVAATGALAMNIFLPSLPGIAKYYQTDYSAAQLLVPVFLAATAFLQLLIGPLSDRFGRRPVLMVSLSIFIVSTIAATMTATIEALLVCRVFQAFASAGIVLSRAVVRDTVEHIDDAASRIGYVTMGMAMVPMVAPTIGGFLDEIQGWQATFWFAALFGIFGLVLVYFDLGETNKSPASNMMEQVRSYPQLFSSRRFWGYTLTAAFSSGCFFAFLGGGPFIATEFLHMSPSGYGIYFGLVALGYMFGNYLSGRFSRMVGTTKMMMSGCLIVVAGIAFSIVLFNTGYIHPLSLFLPAGIIGIGNGMTLPNATAGMVSIRPRLAGAASGLGGTLQLGGGALMALLAAAVLNADSGPNPLLYVMMLSAVLAVATAAYVILVDWQMQDT